MTKLSRNSRVFTQIARVCGQLRGLYLVASGFALHRPAGASARRLRWKPEALEASCQKGVTARPTRSIGIVIYGVRRGREFVLQIIALDGVRPRQGKGLARSIQGQ